MQNGVLAFVPLSKVTGMPRLHLLLSSEVRETTSLIDLTYFLFLSTSVLRGKVDRSSRGKSHEDSLICGEGLVQAGLRLKRVLRKLERAKIRFLSRPKVPSVVPFPTLFRIWQRG
jgi:hypothetical protein